MRVRQPSSSFTTTRALPPAAPILMWQAYGKYVPKIGDTFTLWTAATFKGEPTSVTLPELPEGMQWDTSELLQPTGIIKIIEATGISGITEDGEFDAKVYTVNGVLIGIITSNKDNLFKDIKKLGVEGVLIVKTNKEVQKIVIR